MKTKTTPSFTPGPWRASLQHGRTYLIDSVASGRRENVGDIAVDNPDDARLIAAAPDLLDALLQIEAVYADGEDTHDDWRKMGEIARATLEKFLVGAERGAQQLRPEP